MRINALSGAALVAVLSGTAFASPNDINIQDNVEDRSQFLQDYADTYNAGSLSGIAVNRFEDTTVADANPDSTGTTVNFGSHPFGQDNGNFAMSISGEAGNNDLFVGTTDGLSNRDFNAGNNARPASETFAVAFGNTFWQSNEMTFDFTPGVTAFGFSYEDIGDVGGQLDVTFRDTVNGDLDTISVLVGTGNLADGFMSLVAASGFTIDSITLSQYSASSDADDGFIFYGFSTVQTIPLPPAAFAGLGLLGGLGVVRRLRRK